MKSNNFFYVFTMVNKYYLKCFSTRIHLTVADRFFKSVCCITDLKWKCILVLPAHQASLRAPQLSYSKQARVRFLQRCHIFIENRLFSPIPSTVSPPSTLNPSRLIQDLLISVSLQKRKNKHQRNINKTRYNKERKKLLYQG